KGVASSQNSKRWRDGPNVSELREAFGVRPPCRRFGIAPDHCCPSQKREQAPRTPNAGATCQMSPSSAKRLECVRLAAALASPPTTAVPSKSGSKLHALQTLARHAKCLRVRRSVWTASGLPALWHRPRPLLSLPKAGASSAHSKRWRDVPNVSEFREAFGLRPACRRFGIARDRCCPSEKREQAPRTPNAGARFVSPGPNESLLRFAPVAGLFASQFKNTFIPLVHLPTKSRFMSEIIINETQKKP